MAQAASISAEDKTFLRKSICEKRGQQIIICCPVIPGTSFNDLVRSFPLNFFWQKMFVPTPTRTMACACLYRHVQKLWRWQKTKTNSQKVSSGIWAIVDVRQDTRKLRSVVRVNLLNPLVMLQGTMDRSEAIATMVCWKKWRKIDCRLHHNVGSTLVIAFSEARRQSTTNFCGPLRWYTRTVRICLVLREVVSILSQQLSGKARYTAAGLSLATFTS